MEELPELADAQRDELLVKRIQLFWRILGIAGWGVVGFMTFWSLRLADDANYGVLFDTMTLNKPVMLLLTAMVGFAVAEIFFFWKGWALFGLLSFVGMAALCLFGASFIGDLWLAQWLYDGAVGLAALTFMSIQIAQRRRRA